ncbi:hypothetical protein DOY81_010191, partial [Sarcophaga bullata]
LLQLNMASVAMGVYKDPKYPGKCVIGDKILSNGEQAQVPKQCARMLCRPDSWVKFQYCSPIKPPPGYKLGEPSMLQANYPDCCTRPFIPIL